MRIAILNLEKGRVPGFQNILYTAQKWAKHPFDFKIAIQNSRPVNLGQNIAANTGNKARLLLVCFKC